MIRTVSSFLMFAGLLATGGIRAQPADTVRAHPILGQTFRDARGIGVDPLGALYVADAGRDVVVKMDALGRLMATIGGPGSREGEFDDPSGVDPTNGMALYVADAGNRRIQVFSRSFAYLGSIPLVRGDRASSAGVTYRRQDGETIAFATGIPVAVASSGANEIYAVDADRRAVLKWNKNRRFAGVVGEAGRGALADPVDVWVGGESVIYVADRSVQAVAVYDHYGTFLRWMGAGRLAGVRAVAVAGGRIVAALPRALMLYDPAGSFERRIEVVVPEDIVDVAEGPDGTLYVLCAEHVYWLRTEP